MQITGPHYTALPTPAFRFMVETAAQCSIDSLTDTALVTAIHGESWFITWMQEFLAATSKHFSKPYTAQQVQRITQHALCPDQMTPTDGCTYTVRPRAVTFRGGRCEVEWSVSAVPMIIDIPDLEESPTMPYAESVAHSADQELEEVDDTMLPITNATEMDHVRIQDRQRIKEARLKAKIALYRVQHQMTLYQDRYGESVTESDSESEEEFDTL